MNNFTSTCSQSVDSSTCNGVLNPASQPSTFCVIAVNKKSLVSKKMFFFSI